MRGVTESPVFLEYFTPSGFLYLLLVLECWIIVHYRFTVWQMCRSQLVHESVFSWADWSCVLCVMREGDLYPSPPFGSLSTSPLPPLHVSENEMECTLGEFAKMLDNPIKLLQSVLHRNASFPRPRSLKIPAPTLMTMEYFSFTQCHCWPAERH